MGFNCGIVGLPNVGKSTLFNALTATAAAQAENFPFCTIEPNIGRVSVPDPRLDKIAAIAGSAKIIPTQLEIVDIAGLVKGASKGEGLGNQFLGNIRQLDAVIYMLRCFEDDDVTHVEGSVDPIRDAETIETELMLADMESLEKQHHNTSKKSRSNDKEAKELLVVIEKALAVLEEGKPVRTAEISEDEAPLLKSLQLLTSKPILYVANVDEAALPDGNKFSDAVDNLAKEQGAESVIIAAAIESEIAILDDAEEKAEFLESLDLKEPGLNKVIRAGYKLLDLITFFTIGPKEARAWTTHNQSLAPQCAGVIHTDFERGFIRAETIAYDDFIANNGEQGAKEAGKMRQEGKTYPCKDGDIFHFRFNV